MKSIKKFMLITMILCMLPLSHVYASKASSDAVKPNVSSLITESQTNGNNTLIYISGGSYFTAGNKLSLNVVFSSALKKGAVNWSVSGCPGA
ncbi:MAG: hypothetical protein PHI27_13725 [Eubacteriales bacterium]|nr:hypothetical protein [Eubacteriales bacterium]MDD3883282.1 hypothetical protein [Eubacteriales bacterium]MDD4513903.1 hypothetical protein [Eubacteriales bacterium]